MKFSKSLLKRTLTLSLSCIFAAGILQPQQMAQAAEAGQVRTQTLAQAQAAWQTPAASVSVSQNQNWGYTGTQGSQPGGSQRSRQAERSENDTFSLSRERMRLRKGSTKILRVENPGSLSGVKWSVSDKNIISVRKSSRSISITGLNDGIAAVTAKAGDRICVCRIKVGKGDYMSGRTMQALGLDPAAGGYGYASGSSPAGFSAGRVTSVSLNKYSLMIEQGTSELLTAQYSPADAGAAVVWESSNPALASVTGGMVTAIAPGSAKITAKAGSRQAVCEVLVIEHPKQAVIAEQGYSCYQAGDRSHSGITYAARIHNPNTTFNLALTGADIVVHDKKGTVLKRESCLLTELAPQDTLSVAGDLRLDRAKEEIGQVSISIHTIPVSSFYTHDDRLYLKSSSFTVRNTSDAPDGSGGRRLTGYVQRNVQQAGQYIPYITVLFRRNGVLAGGARALLNPSGQGAFEIGLDAPQAAALASCTAEYGIGF